jgi:hypothetical protein
MKFGVNSRAHIDSWKDMAVAEDSGSPAYGLRFANALQRYLRNDDFGGRAYHAHQDRHRHRRSQQSDRAGHSAFYRDHQPTCTGARDARGWNRIHRPQHDGLSPVRLDDLREHVRICRALLCGGEVLFREGIGKPVPLSC